MPAYVDDDLARALGDSVKAMRASRGWTLRELADLARLNFSYVRKIENGQSATPAAYSRLARAFGVRFSFLMKAGDDVHAATFPRTPRARKVKSAAA